MRKLLAFLKPLFVQLFLAICTLVFHYYYFNIQIEREFLRKDPNSIEFISVYFISILSVWFIFLIRRRLGVKNFYSYIFQPFESALIPALFLILSTIFVYPMSFVLVFADVRRNLLLHFFIASSIPYLYFFFEDSRFGICDNGGKATARCYREMTRRAKAMTSHSKQMNRQGEEEMNIIMKLNLAKTPNL